MHGAELEKLKTRRILAYALLAEKCRPGGSQFDGDSYDQHQRPNDRQRNRTDKDVKDALAARKAPGGKCFSACRDRSAGRNGYAAGASRRLRLLHTTFSTDLTTRFTSRSFMPG